MMKKRKDPVFDLERAYADCHRIALSLANGEPCGRALDLGAGQGALSQALKERGFEVTAADVNAEQFLATGFFDLFVPTKKRLKDPFSSEADGHISPLPGWLLRYFLEDAGFEIEKTRYTMAYIPLVPRAFLKFFRGPFLGRIGINSSRKPAGLPECGLGRESP